LLLFRGYREKEEGLLAGGRAGGGIGGGG